MLPTKRSELIHALSLVPHSEGGYFLETFRTGCTPMASQQPTDESVESEDIKRTSTGETRNVLSSRYFVPTIQAPKQRLASYKSDHVHYFQGGQPFEYILYDPETEKLEHVIMGPDICNGEKLQVPVRSDLWTCGRIMTETTADAYEFTLIGEAFVPGFDATDFKWISIDELEKRCPIHVQKILKEFVSETEISGDRGHDRDLAEVSVEEEKKECLSPSQYRRLFQLNYEPV